MTDSGMMYLWGGTIFVLLYIPLIFVLMEFSLDKKKREVDGVLRVKKNGFVIYYFYKSYFCHHTQQNPKNLCDLFWGLFFGLLVNSFVLFVLYLFSFYFFPVLVTESDWWLVIKVVLGIILAVVIVVGVAAGAVLFSEGKFMPATKDWLVAKKKKICPMVKLVD